MSIKYLCDKSGEDADFVAELHVAGADGKGKPFGYQFHFTKDELKKVLEYMGMDAKKLADAFTPPKKPGSHNDAKGTANAKKVSEDSSVSGHA